MKFITDRAISHAFTDTLYIHLQPRVWFVFVIKYSLEFFLIFQKRSFRKCKKKWNKIHIDSEKSVIFFGYIYFNYFVNNFWAL